VCLLLLLASGQGSYWVLLPCFFAGAYSGLDLVPLGYNICYFILLNDRVPVYLKKSIQFTHSLKKGETAINAARTKSQP
jgi:hypothetical protein